MSDDERRVHEPLFYPLHKRPQIFSALITYSPAFLNVHARGSLAGKAAPDGSSATSRLGDDPSER
jgi:hypothetical protein